jgi:segregation and condensation protein B
MRNRATSTGRLLRSVALRYQAQNPQFAEQLPTALKMATLSGGIKKNAPPKRGGKFARDERLTQVEAILFLAQQPIGSRKLAQLADLADGTKARTLVRKLNRLYDAEGSAFRVEEVAGGFQLLTRSKFAHWLRRLHAAPVDVRLSGPAMETLAVIAYRQPVLRADIEAIRGVQSGEVLRQLIERDMVRIVGRSSELGRPFLYGTGKRFLQVFGLRHLDELPQSELIQHTGDPNVPGRHRPGGLGESETEQYAAAESSPASAAAKEIQKTPNQFPEAEEEKNVKTLTTTKARPEFFAQEPSAALMEPERRKLSGRKAAFNQVDDDEDFDEEEEDEDFDDEEFDDLDDEEEEEEEDEELDDDWEEVEDDDEEEEDEEWDDDDEDWDDDDWDDDEDDFDDDDDDDEDEEEEEDGED